MQIILDVSLDTAKVVTYAPAAVSPNGKLGCSIMYFFDLYICAHMNGLQIKNTIKTRFMQVLFRTRLA